MQATTYKMLPQLDGRQTADQSAETANTSLVIRNVTIDSRRTSIRLEPEMWQALADICKREHCSVHNICTMIASLKTGPGSLTAAIRVFIMAYFRDAATEDGHNRNGHGSGAILQPLYAKLARETIRAGDRAGERTPAPRRDW